MQYLQVNVDRRNIRISIIFGNNENSLTKEKENKSK